MYEFKTDGNILLSINCMLCIACLHAVCNAEVGFKPMLEWVPNLFMSIRHQNMQQLDCQHTLRQARASVQNMQICKEAIKYKQYESPDRLTFIQSPDMH